MLQMINQQRETSKEKDSKLFHILWMSFVIRYPDDYDPWIYHPVKSIICGFWTHQNTHMIGLEMIKLNSFPKNSQLLPPFHAPNITVHPGMFVNRMQQLAHYSDVTVSTLASQIIGVSTVCLSFCLDEHHIKHQSLCYRPFWGVTQRWPMDSPKKWSVTLKSFPFWNRFHHDLLSEEILQIRLALSRGL